jgi:hypothetical protein
VRKGGLQNGTYLRNGPGLWDVGDCTFHHLFDGYATPAVQRPQHDHQGRLGGEDVGQELARGGRRAIRALLRGQAGRN